MAIQELLEKADFYRDKIQVCKPINPEQLTELDNYFRDKYNYDTAEQKEAFDYMLSQARLDKLHISEAIIKNLHYLLFQKKDKEEAGKYRRVQVHITASEYLPPMPEDLPHLMEHFINQMENSKKLLHPIEYAALCHKRLSDIHPFKEGNGRVARLFMNLILENEGYGIISIPKELLDEYIGALLLTQNKNFPDIDPLIKFIAERVIESEKEYVKILHI